MISENDRKRIVQALIDEERKINIGMFFSEDELHDFLNFLRISSPILFHLGEMKYSINRLTRNTSIYPQYLMTSEEHKQVSNAVLQRINVIKREFDLVSDLSEKERYIHDFLCSNIVYAEEGNESHTILGPLLNGRGVCEGIAKTAQLLLKLCGIPACIIEGSASSEKKSNVPHAWNAVRIKDKWCQCDFTFDIAMSRIGFTRYDYYNISTYQISSDHVVEYDPWQVSGLCTSDENSYYSTNRLVVYSVNDLDEFIKQKVHMRQRNIQFRMKCSLPDVICASTVEEHVHRVLSGAKGLRSYTYNYNSKQQVYCAFVEYNN